MRLFTSILATVAMLAMAPAAFAGVIYTATAVTSDSSPLNAVTPGAQIIIDITVRTDDFALGLEGSVNNYDNSVVALDAVGSSISASFFNSVCYGANACFYGLTNLVGTSITFQETASGPNQEVAFMVGLGTSAAQGDGSLDQAPDGSGSGAPQFQIVFDAIGAPGSSTTMDIGTFLPFGDLYTGTVDSNSTNTAVSITIVPEPGTAILMGLGLAGLAGAGRRK